MSLEEIVLDLGFEEGIGFRLVGVRAVSYQGHFQQNVHMEGQGDLKA